MQYYIPLPHALYPLSVFMLGFCFWLLKSVLFWDTASCRHLLVLLLLLLLAFIWLFRKAFMGFLVADKTGKLLCKFMLEVLWCYHYSKGNCAPVGSATVQNLVLSPNWSSHTASSSKSRWQTLGGKPAIDLLQIPDCVGWCVISQCHRNNMQIIFLKWLPGAEQMLFS